MALHWFSPAVYIKDTKPGMTAGISHVEGERLLQLTKRDRSGPCGSRRRRGPDRRRAPTASKRTRRLPSCSGRKTSRLSGLLCRQDEMASRSGGRRGFIIFGEEKAIQVDPAMTAVATEA